MKNNISRRNLTKSLAGGVVAVSLSPTAASAELAAPTNGDPVPEWVAEGAFSFIQATQGNEVAYEFLKEKWDGPEGPEPDVAPVKGKIPEGSVIAKSSILSLGLASFDIFKDEVFLGSIVVTYHADQPPRPFLHMKYIAQPQQPIDHVIPSDLRPTDNNFIVLNNHLFLLKSAVGTMKVTAFAKDGSTIPHVQLCLNFADQSKLTSVIPTQFTDDNGVATFEISASDPSAVGYQGTLDIVDVNRKSLFNFPITAIATKPTKIEATGTDLNNLHYRQNVKTQLVTDGVPAEFTTDSLVPGLTMDFKTGSIQGVVEQSSGTYDMKMFAFNVFDSSPEVEYKNTILPSSLK